MANSESADLTKLVFDKPWQKELRAASLAMEAGSLLAAQLKESVEKYEELIGDHQGKIIGLTASVALQFVEEIDTYRVAPSTSENGQSTAITGSFEGLTVFDRETWDWEIPECPYDQLEVCLVVEPFEGQHFLVAARHIVGYVSTPSDEQISA